MGHIEGARNIPLDAIQARTAALLGQDLPLVLVCHTDRRSASAADHLLRASATEIAVLRGGMMSWRAGTIR